MPRFCFIFCGLILWAAMAHSQSITFGSTFTTTGQLQSASDAFRFTPPERVIAMQLTSPRPLSSEKLYIIVKNLDGTVGRFLMKRASSKTTANALVRIKAPGIYRVYVFSPDNLRRHYAYARLFVTNEELPTKKALVEAQRQQLVAQGKLKPEQLAAARAKEKKPKPETAKPTPKDAPEPEPEPQLDTDLDFDDALDFDGLDDLPEGDLGSDDLADLDMMEDLGGLDNLEDDLDDIGDAETDSSDDDFEDYDVLDDDFDFEIDDF